MRREWRRAVRWPGASLPGLGPRGAEDPGAWEGWAPSDISLERDGGHRREGLRRLMRLVAGERGKSQ